MEMDMAVTTALRQLDATGLKNLQTIQIAIREALFRTGHRELRGLGLECHGDAVTISGRVPTFYLKQLVQSIASASPGVGQINNQLHVC
jgi:osmotically-inducible protein OsmY